MKISIYTVTLGTRPHYLMKLYEFLNKHKNEIHEWIIGIQGFTGDIKIPQNNFTKIVNWKNNCGAGEANNRLIKMCSGDLIFKLDDDALPYGDDYFVHSKELFRLTNYASIISPYPVGLINNPGGILSKNHKVVYSANTDTYYTLRKVPHIGGFARMAPAEIVRSFTWPQDYIPGTSGREDVNFSEYCGIKKIEMFYVENSIIVEHQESTLGQHERYREYFTERY